MGILKEDISAENTFSAGIYINGVFDFSLSGTWSGTITVQRKRDDAGASWEDVEDFNGNGIYPGEDIEKNVAVQYRFGFKTGNYTSGAATGRFSE